MKERKTKVAVWTLGIILFALFFHRKQNCVEPAISWQEAFVKNDGKQYYIVGDFKIFRDGWHYLDEGKWKEVRLIGKSPQNELSWTISGEEAANRFLIKGKKEPQLKKMAGKEVIYVEDWSVIAPVHRIYQDESDGKRFFSPLFYLDQYDRENGDYYDIVTDIYAISSVEKRWIEQNSKMSCFTITSDITDNRVEWFIKEKNGCIPIVVNGNTPENNFGEEILRGFRNSFLVEGNLSEDKKILEIYSWNMCAPIDRGDAGLSCTSFFKREDIEKGIYIPDISEM
ncbi:MAG: hypothetical protein K2P64_00275 [Lachnospiraceae bacterium]|nr:hypothetical protein [Lachnospiraceae bacterium]